MRKEGPNDRTGAEGAAERDGTLCAAGGGGGERARPRRLHGGREGTANPSPPLCPMETRWRATHAAAPAARADMQYLRVRFQCECEYTGMSSSSRMSASGYSPAAAGRGGRAAERGRREGAAETTLPYTRGAARRRKTPVRRLSSSLLMTMVVRAPAGGEGGSMPDARREFGQGSGATDRCWQRG